jgi:hypothetical protein
MNADGTVSADRVMDCTKRVDKLVTELQGKEQQ